MDGQRDRFVEQILVRDSLAAAHAGVGGDDEFRRCVVDPRGQRPGSEAAEHDGMDRADPRAREHGKQGFGNHRHVDEDAVSFADAQALHDCRHANDFGFQFGEGIDDFLIGFGRNENQGTVVRPLRRVAVDGVVADVGFAADEPLGERRPGKIENLAERLVPVDALGFFTPEGVRIFD